MLIVNQPTLFQLFDILFSGNGFDRLSLTMFKILIDIWVINLSLSKGYQ